MAITQNWRKFNTIAGFTIVLTIFNCISVSESIISCYECSSVNDTYCPEFMTNDDESVVPMNSCKYVHDGEYCIKETGVTAGTGGLSCYRCDESKDVDFGCSDLLFGARLHDCSDVFDAQYCIKSTGIYAGSLGTRRFCSSRDMGNYCEYIRRPGDPHEYRSCVFTCSSDGCNPAPTLHPNFNLSSFIFLLNALCYIYMVIF